MRPYFFLADIIQDIYQKISILLSGYVIVPKKCKVNHHHEETQIHLHK